MATKRNTQNVATGDTNPVAAINTDIVSDGVIERRSDQPDNANRRGPVVETKKVTTLYSAEQQAVQQHKALIRQEVSQRLAEAHDLYEMGDQRHGEAKAIADRAAVSLYQARIENALSVEEMNSTLRDVFGAKKKGGGGVMVSSTDPEASKTPFGKGEDIRKRVVRAEAAFQCANGNVDGAGAFFEGLTGESEDKDGRTLRDVLELVNSDQLSIWSAYDAFAAIKRNHAERVNPAFDPAKISAIVDALDGDEAFDIIEGNPSLKAVYNGLMEKLLVYFPVVEVKADAKAA